MIDTRNCVAQIHHGPGHNIITPCTRNGPHAVHECYFAGKLLRWLGDVGYTDFNDEIPYISE